jgi:DNA (cytosine-5)-methyltransferase 1
MSNKIIKIGTVFSGIGAIEFAFKRLGVKNLISFACDNGNRNIDIDVQNEIIKIKKLNNVFEKKIYVDNIYNQHTKKKNYVQTTYLANYSIDPNYFFQDIRLLDGKDFSNKIDLFVGGSPCQSFSAVGAKNGQEDARGTLFYDYARLVNEIKPKVFIFENVKNLLNHDKGNTWNTIRTIFDKLGYFYEVKVLNSKEFGIPQNRRRIFVVGFKKREFLNKFKFPSPKELKFNTKDFLIEQNTLGSIKFDENGLIRIDNIKGICEEKYFLSPKLLNYVMKSGTKSFYQEPKIDLEIARTILSTMGNRHRAGVDNYVTVSGKIRMLNEREAFRLMGFTDDFKIVVSRAQAYKQAGNSIVVDVLMELVNSIINTGVFNGG